MTFHERKKTQTKKQLIGKKIYPRHHHEIVCLFVFILARFWSTKAFEKKIIIAHAVSLTMSNCERKSEESFNVCLNKRN